MSSVKLNPWREERTRKPKWRDKKFDYTSGELDYKGFSLTPNASTSEAIWWIWKYTYTGTNIIREQGPEYGSWDGRAALDWT